MKDDIIYGCSALMSESIDNLDSSEFDLTLPDATNANYANTILYSLAKCANVMNFLVAINEVNEIEDGEVYEKTGDEALEVLVHLQAAAFGIREMFSKSEILSEHADFIQDWAKEASVKMSDKIFDNAEEIKANYGVEKNTKIIN